MKANNKKFLLLWFGQFISSIGGGLTSFGLGVYVFEKTGSATAMAMVTLFAFFPTLLLSVPAGILADRYDRRFLMMIGDGCSALGIAYIWSIISRGALSLVEICLGVGFSSIFAALLEPAYKATISDLLSEEDYSKASGLVSLASSARYLISPLLAGILLAKYSIQVLLMIDILTFFLTVICTAVVRGKVETKPVDKQESYLIAFRSGWSIISKNKGVLTLILLSSLITYLMGVIQVLAEPLILSFSTSQVLGMSETICASGMLVSGLYLGIVGIKKHFILALSLSLSIAGFAMILFGFKENILLICFAGFIFFAMLPFANNCLDVMIRRHIPAHLQGRAWGLIGFISQLGYIFAFCLAGIIADSLGRYLNIGVGRGAGYTILIAGFILMGFALLLSQLPAVRYLENEGGIRDD